MCISRFSFFFFFFVSDKLLTAQVLSANQIPIPKTVLSMFPMDAKFIAKELGFPLIVKKVSGARGEGLYCF
jgi:gamma-F420-2:alpha-L-glutamate ligase